MAPAACARRSCSGVCTVTMIGAFGCLARSLRIMSSRLSRVLARDILFLRTGLLLFVELVEKLFAELCGLFGMQGHAGRAGDIAQESADDGVDRI